MLPTATFAIDRPAPGVAAVVIEGDLDAYSAPDLRDTYVDLINEAAFRQVFDLSAVTRIDSTGFGVIVGALKNLRARGGELALVVPFEGADVRHALTITGLAKTIPHADTLDGALGLLAPKLEPQDEAARWRTAFESLHARLLRDLPGDASELPQPDDEFWARQLDELVAYASELYRETETEGAR